MLRDGEIDTTTSREPAQTYPVEIASLESGALARKKVRPINDIRAAIAHLFGRLGPGSGVIRPRGLS